MSFLCFCSWNCIFTGFAFCFVTVSVYVHHRAITALVDWASNTSLLRLTVYVHHRAITALVDWASNTSLLRLSVYVRHRAITPLVDWASNTSLLILTVYVHIFWCCLVLCFHISAHSSAYCFDCVNSSFRGCWRTSQLAVSVSAGCAASWC